MGEPTIVDVLYEHRGEIRHHAEYLRDLADAARLIGNHNLADKLGDVSYAIEGSTNRVLDFHGQMLNREFQEGQRHMAKVIDTLLAQ